MAKSSASTEVCSPAALTNELDPCLFGSQRCPRRLHSRLSYVYSRLHFRCYPGALMANVDLRPMSIGEVLDRTFKLYKNEFWLFTGIMSLPFLGVFVFNILMGLGSSRAVSSLNVGSPSFSPGLIATGVGGVALFLVLMLFLMCVGQAATIFAVSDVYLGRPATIRSSFAQVRGHILQVIGTILLVFFLLGVGVALCIVPITLIVRVSPLLIFGLILLVLFGVLVLACRLALAVPVVTLEHDGVVAAVSRSMDLTKGFAMQIFLILFLYWVLSSIASVIFTFPFLFMSMLPRPHVLPFGITVLQDVATFIAQVLVAPIETIAISLMYYNLRVRKEGFDLEHLMSTMGTSSPSAMPAPDTALPS